MEKRLHTEDMYHRQWLCSRQHYSKTHLVIVVSVLWSWHCVSCVGVRLLLKCCSSFSTFVIGLTLTWLCVASFAVRLHCQGQATKDWTAVQIRIPHKNTECSWPETLWYGLESPPYQEHESFLWKNPGFSCLKSCVAIIPRCLVSHPELPLIRNDSLFTFRW